MLLRNIILAVVMVFLAGNADAAVSCRENALGGQTCTDRATGDVWRGRRDATGNMKYTNRGQTIKSRAVVNGTTIYTDKSGAHTTCRKNASVATVCRDASGNKTTCRTNAVGHIICK